MPFRLTAARRESVTESKTDTGGLVNWSRINNKVLDIPRKRAVMRSIHILSFLLLIYTSFRLVTQNVLAPQKYALSTDLKFWFGLARPCPSPSHWTSASAVRVQLASNQDVCSVLPLCIIIKVAYSSNSLCYLCLQSSHHYTVQKEQWLSVLYTVNSPFRTSRALYGANNLGRKTQ